LLIVAGTDIRALRESGKIDGMSRNVKIAVAVLLVVGACLLIGSSAEGWAINLGGAIGVAVVATLILIYRNKPVAHSTRAIEVRWLPVYCVEMLLVAGISLLVISGGCALEIAIGTIGLVFVVLKGAAHIYIWLKIPPT
jgi:hypothetical protein